MEERSREARDRRGTLGDAQPIDRVADSGTLRKADPGRGRPGDDDGPLTRDPASGLTSFTRITKTPDLPRSLSPHT